MPTFAAVGLVVADMAATLRFYRMLGLDIPSSLDGESHVEVGTDAGVRLMFDTEALIRSIDADWKPPVGRGRVALAFLCENPDAVDAAYRRIVDAGHQAVQAPFDAFWGQRYATVLDPDGNPVDLFAQAE